MLSVFQSSFTLNSFRIRSCPDPDLEWFFRIRILLKIFYPTGSEQHGFEHSWLTWEIKLLPLTWECRRQRDAGFELGTLGLWHSSPLCCDFSWSNFQRKLFRIPSWWKQLRRSSTTSSCLILKQRLETFLLELWMPWLLRPVLCIRIRSFCLIRMGIQGLPKRIRSRICFRIHFNQM